VRGVRKVIGKTVAVPVACRACGRGFYWSYECQTDLCEACEWRERL
jgi:hypothetical protein